MSWSDLSCSLKSLKHQRVTCGQETQLVNSRLDLSVGLCETLLRRTGEAGGPRDVQVEVLGGVDEHVQIPVGLWGDRGVR